MKNIYKYPIFRYNHFLKNDANDTSNGTIAEKFEGDIQYLIKNGYESISLFDLYKRETEGKSLPRRGFVIVLEDGYYSEYEIAFPILKKHNVHADIFVVTELMGMNEHPVFKSFIPHFGEAEIIEMESSGLVTVHSHGHKHKWEENWTEQEKTDNLKTAFQELVLMKKDDFICCSWHGCYMTDKNIDLMSDIGYKYHLIDYSLLTDDLAEKRCLGMLGMDNNTSVELMLALYTDHLYNNTSLMKPEKAQTSFGETYIIDTDSTDTPLQNNQVVVYKNTEQALNYQYDLEIQVDSSGNIIEINYDGNSAVPTGGFIVSTRGKSIYPLLVAAENANRVVFDNELLYLIQQNEESNESHYNQRKPFEKRAIWHRPYERTEQEVLQTIQQISDLNLNIIHLETWYSGHFVGHSNNPLVRSTNREFDVLEAFCRLGHKAGIEIHAWVENFFIGTEPDLYDSDNPLTQYFMEKILINKKGEKYCDTVNGKFIFLNPADRECRDFVIDFYKEMIEKYDIDGLHLDYIRFPEPNGENDFGYNENIVRGFKDRLERDVDIYNLNYAENKEWNKYRQEIINSFVEEVYRTVKSIRKEIWVSCACFADLESAPERIYQDVKSWVDGGYIDEVVSMSYTIDHRYIEGNTKIFNELCGEKVFYSVGISLLGYLPGYELEKQIFAAQNTNTKGVVFFSYAKFKFDNYKDVIKKNMEGFQEIL